MPYALKKPFQQQMNPQMRMEVPEEGVDSEATEPEESSGLHEVSLPGHHLAQPGRAHVVQAEEVAHLVQQQLFREVSEVGLVVAHVQAEAVLYLQKRRYVHNLSSLTNFGILWYNMYNVY